KLKNNHAYWMTGCSYMKLNDHIKSYECFWNGHLEGELFSILELGRSYIEGYIESEFEKGCQIFKDSLEILNSNSNLNCKMSQYYLALMYKNGWGIEKSEEMFLKLLQQSANQKFFLAVDLLESMKVDA
ncbi:MAG: hypothetical protein ACRC4L_00195, partial [Mycoplasma sp.]